MLTNTNRTGTVEEATISIRSEVDVMEILSAANESGMDRFWTTDIASLYDSVFANEVDIEHEIDAFKCKTRPFSGDPGRHEDG